MPLPSDCGFATREQHPDHVNLQEYERMLSSPDTELERVGLKRNTSIIEKLTNITYSTVERENDAILVDCLAEREKLEQDISPQLGKGKASPSKRRKAARKKQNVSVSVNDGETESASPSIDLNSKLSSSQSEASPLLIGGPHQNQGRAATCFVVDKNKPVSQIV